MKFSFKATIYKVGINPCVKVPFSITDKMKAVRGYIPVKGKINNHLFQQTLCAVKNEKFRLYVNGPMLKGSNTKLGDIVKFIIEPDEKPKTTALPMPLALKKELKKNNLMAVFEKLIPSRQKEILKYLNYLKSEEAVERNIKKVIEGLNKENNN